MIIKKNGTYGFILVFDLCSMYIYYLSLSMLKYYYYKNIEFKIEHRNSILYVIWHF